MVLIAVGLRWWGFLSSTNGTHHIALAFRSPELFERFHDIHCSVLNRFSTSSRGRAWRWRVSCILRFRYPLLSRARGTRTGMAWERMPSRPDPERSADMVQDDGGF